MADLPIAHEAFAGRGLVLRPAGFLRGPRLLIDGSEAKGRRQRYSLRDNIGNQVEVRLRGNGIDPVPKVEIAGRTIELARPLTWYEYVWMGIPIVLVVAGGALGAVFGLLGIYASARIFRGERSTGAKFGLSALVSLGAVLGFFVTALFLQLLIGPPAQG